LSGLSSTSSLAEWLLWQENNHPKEIDLGLERVASVYKQLAISENSRPYTITVAGTNGKGSSVALLESILLAAGYKVGVYSTPHLLQYNERIRVNATMVSDAQLSSSFADIDSARESISLSYFEYGTLAALDIFSKLHVDVQILEVGLGGRLDAVNIIDADAVLITSIDIDHIDWLGNDRATIALEKAGVFRPAQKAVCGDKAVPETLLNYANELKTDLLCAGIDYDLSFDTKQWTLKSEHCFSGTYQHPALKGDHQIQNAAAVVSLLGHIKQVLPVTKENIDLGLSKVFLAGRLQLIPGQPQVLLDVAHNPESARALASFLDNYEDSITIRAVFSILEDKDLGNVLKPFLKRVKKWYIAPLDASRAKLVSQISTKIKLDDTQQCFEAPTIKAAFLSAKSQSAPADLIICFGSFYVVEACLGAL